MLFPLEYTSSQFAHILSTQFERGYTQALSLYQSYVRKGTVEKTAPFANAPALYEKMVSSISLNVDPVHSQYEDGNTSRFLLKTFDDHLIESVLITMKHGYTLCISSQIGCRMGCTFCKTGQLGLIRNLSVQEIVQQLFIAKFVLKKKVHNIVFMGMGEPLDNLDAVLQAIDIFSDPIGFNIGQKQITISTSGQIDAIYQLASLPHFPANLTVSLNAPNDLLRAQLMPKKRKISLHDLYQALCTYCQKRKKRVYISYVLIKEINDSLLHADELASFIDGLNTRINLIPFNTFPGTLYQSPENRNVLSFFHRLRQQNIPVFLRETKGDAIQAACGQLAGSL